jgi:hypothetical protein
VLAGALVLVLGAVVLMGAGPGPHEHEQPLTVSGRQVVSVQSGHWSDPRTWSTGAAPVAGDVVTIGGGHRVTYDMASESSIAQLDVQGTLEFSRDRSTSLDVGNVFVRPGGRLLLGTPEAPIPQGVRARVRFVADKDGERGLEVTGEAQIHGAPISFVYSRLAAPVRRGDRVLTLVDAVDWNPGDQIVIVTTSGNPQETEENDVERVQGNTVFLRRPLRFQHDGVAPTQTEVALLSRNVLITSKDPAKRGFTMFHRGAQGSISYAVFRSLGAEGQLGKYPIHFHQVGDTMAGAFVKGVAVWDSGNRFITVHSTQGVRLSRNVGYKSVGHGFFLENGDEVDNVLDGNLAIMTMPGAILPSDVYAAGFWTMNPHNTFTNNVAAAGRRGFFCQVPNRPMDLPGLGEDVSLQSLAFQKFAGNQAHSNTNAGFVVQGLGMARQSKPSTITGLVAWRNGTTGVTLDGNGVEVSEALLFGNAEANLVIRGNNNRVEGGRFMGELPGAPPQDVRRFHPSAKGVLLGGVGNMVSGAVMSGHEGNDELANADVALLQDDMRPVQATLVNTVMRSSRPILFGFPQNRRSYLEVRGFQGQTGNDFRLYRLDLTGGQSCRGQPDLAVIAMRCAVAQAGGP